MAIMQQERIQSGGRQTGGAGHAQDADIAIIPRSCCAIAQTTTMLPPFAAKQGQHLRLTRGTGSLPSPTRSSSARSSKKSITPFLQHQIGSFRGEQQRECRNGRGKWCCGTLRMQQLRGGISHWTRPSASAPLNISSRRRICGGK